MDTLLVWAKKYNQHIRSFFVFCTWHYITNPVPGPRYENMAQVYKWSECSVQYAICKVFLAACLSSLVYLVHRKYMCCLVNRNSDRADMYWDCQELAIQEVLFSYARQLCFREPICKLALGRLCVSPKLTEMPMSRPRLDVFASDHILPA